MTIYRYIFVRALFSSLAKIHDIVHLFHSASDPLLKCALTRKMFNVFFLSVVLCYVSILISFGFGIFVLLSRYSAECHFRMEGTANVVLQKHSVTIEMLKNK